MKFEVLLWLTAFVVGCTITVVESLAVVVAATVDLAAVVDVDVVVNRVVGVVFRSTFVKVERVFLFFGEFSVSTLMIPGKCI